MKSGFDINIINGDGYLVIPISMARIRAGQSPEEIYEIFHYFAQKLQNFSNDVILLYTNGLYFNTDNLTYQHRVKTNQQIIDHSNELRKLIAKRKQYIPDAFHFLPIDYVILNTSCFKEYFNKLKKFESIDKNFKEAIKQDMGERNYSEANINFILEELAVTHIIRERLVEFPRTLVKNDIWRLVVYPGTYLKSDLYQWKRNILPKSDTINPFRDAQYNFDLKKLFIFKEL